MNNPVIRRLARYFTRHLDGALLGVLLALMAVGLLVLFSASNASTARVTAQVVNMLVALGVMWVFANIPPHYLMRFAFPLYVLGVLLLVGVALFGDVVNGARRWLDVGVTRIQPSELMKIAVPLHARLVFRPLRGDAEALAITRSPRSCCCVPVALIARQPDLGTAVLISGGGFLRAVPRRAVLAHHPGLAIAAAVAACRSLWSALHDYQRQRILTLLDPTQDPLGAGYHTIQSTIAVGSGGWFGKGWLNGTQTHLDFIPERTTDFIFAVYSEEFGLLGNLLLLAAVPAGDRARHR